MFKKKEFYSSPTTITLVVRFGGGNILQGSTTVDNQGGSFFEDADLDDQSENSSGWGSGWGY